MFMPVYLCTIAATVLLGGRMIPGVRIKNVPSAIGVALVFSGLNWLLGGFIKLLLVVPAILTLGLLFLFVPFIVNTIILWLTDKVLQPFELRTAKALLTLSAVITGVSGLMHLIVR